MGLGFCFTLIGKSIILTLDEVQKMFCIVVYGTFGKCLIGLDNLPTWDIKNALTFYTRQEAGDYITNNWKDWSDTMECMRIKEKSEVRL